MNAKKGKDVATNMILDDLLDDEETIESSRQGEGCGEAHVGQDSLGEEIFPDEDSLPFFGPSGDEVLRPQDEEGSGGVDQVLQLDKTNVFPEQTGDAKSDKAATHSKFKKKKSKEALGTTVDNVHRSVGRFIPVHSGGVMGPAEASLAQSENLRIAQQRILDLEKEMERLRGENEKLVTAGEMIRKKADELLSKNETIEGKYSFEVSSLTEEKNLLKKSLVSKDQDIDKLKAQLDEMESRLNTTLKKIRVRERELENRLELVKMESAALVRNKDEIILELKRQIDQVNLELGNYQHKGQELNKQLNDKQEMLKRTVKALRIALTMLEGADSTTLKKVK